MYITTYFSDREKEKKGKKVILIIFYWLTLIFNFSCSMYKYLTKKLSHSI